MNLNQRTPSALSEPPSQSQGSLMQHITGRLEDTSARMSLARARQGQSRPQYRPDPAGADVVIFTNA